MRLGETQELVIVKKVDFGVYLSDAEAGKNDVEKVLLPGKEVPENAKLGDKMRVFIYRDSKDRLIATTRTPELSVGELAVLKVKEVSKIGAFLGWTLEKDLLLPFKEQTTRVMPGKEYLVALYIDKSGRLCTTMKVEPYLRTDSPYRKDDQVEGVVYEIHEKYGVFVAVDHRYQALIPRKEPASGVKVGDHIKARVAEVLADGKLTLSLREKAYLQINTDAEKILKMLEEEGGRIPFNDKADPEYIREATGMSKNEFKRAVGNLYKQRLIVIEPDGIRRV
ncbi:MAG: S1 RNA-binding domain-containing protein [Suilimivivens sp.]